VLATVTYLSVRQQQGNTPSSSDPSSGLPREPSRP
jgi:hypothetical protein